MFYIDGIPIEPIQLNSNWWYTRVNTQWQGMIIVSILHVHE